MQRLRCCSCELYTPPKESTFCGTRCKCQAHASTLGLGWPESSGRGKINFPDETICLRCRGSSPTRNHSLLRRSCLSVNTHLCGDLNPIRDLDLMRELIGPKLGIPEAKMFIEMRLVFVNLPIQPWNERETDRTWWWWLCVDSKSQLGTISLIPSGDKQSHREELSQVDVELEAQQPQ